VSKLSKCCCDCCITEEEMPWETVTLKAPYETCNGVTEPPTYPSQPLVRQGCCYVAEFELDCQTATNVCDLWARRNYSFSYTADFYKTQTDFINRTTPPTTPVCDCIKYQTKQVSFDGKIRIYYLAQYDLIRLRITVGKALTKCDEDAEPVCRFFVATTYYYTILEDISNAYVYKKIDNACTGVYRNGICSYTNSWTEEEGTDSDNCPEGLVVNPATAELDIGSFTRIKFYDTLPTGEVSLTNADSLPNSCCTGKTNCTFVVVPCGLSDTASSDRCLPALPEFDGQFEDICYPGMQDDRSNPGFGDSTGCFSILPKDEAVLVMTQAYYIDGPCNFVQDAPFTPNCLQEYPGFDYFASEKDPDRIFGNPSMCGTLNDYCLGGEDPPLQEFCEVEGSTGCCFRFDDQGMPIANNCIDLQGSCQRDLRDLTCSITTSHFTAGDVCFPVPTVTLEFA